MIGIKIKRYIVLFDIFQKCTFKIGTPRCTKSGTADFKMRKTTLQMLCRNGIQLDKFVIGTLPAGV